MTGEATTTLTHTGYSKRKIMTQVSLIGDFKDSVIGAVHEQNMEGGICGHIYLAAIKFINVVHYWD